MRRIAAGEISSVRTLATVTAIGIGLWIANRIERRKIFAQVYALVMAAAMFAPIVSPTWNGMLAFAALGGTRDGRLCHRRSDLDVACPAAAGTRPGATLPCSSWPAPRRSSSRPGSAADLIRYFGYDSLFIVCAFVTLLAGPRDLGAAQRALSDWRARPGSHSIDRRADHAPARGRRRMTRKTPETLRSARWFAPDDFRSFGHRSRMNQMGYSAADYVGKPIIGIVNTWSDLNQCHAHFKTRVEDVKRGVLQAGGFPVELPAISLSETKVKPTTMLYRNFLAMETEELIRSHPDRRRRADGRLRQDDARPDARRDQRRRSRHLRARRADAARQLARQGARLRLRRDQILGRAPRREYLATRTGRRWRSASRAPTASA